MSARAVFVAWALSCLLLFVPLCFDLIDCFLEFFCMRLMVWLGFGWIFEEWLFFWKEF